MYNSSGYVNTYPSCNGFENYQHQYYAQPNNDSNYSFWCDVCDRGFPNKMILQKHISEHQTCNIDGCTYVAHPNIITKHIQMQHSNGLFNRIRSLNTPEDIAKWISDRKRRYPSKENIEKRYKINEEKKKRGEVLTSQSIRKNHNKQNNNKDGKTNFKKAGKFQKRLNKYKEKIENKPKLKIVNKEDWKGDLPPFPGTRIAFPNDISADEQEEESETSDDSFEIAPDDRFDDDEWKEEIKNPVENNIQIKNALGMLMSTYGSSDEECKEEEIKKDVEKDNALPDDEDPPDEEPIIRVQNNVDQPCEKPENIEKQNEIVENSDNNDVTEIMRSDQPSCSIETNTERANTSKNDEESNSKKRKRNKKNDLNDKNKNRPKKIFKKETLLEMLLRNEIRHERNILLQCIKYIVDNNFFGLTR